MPDNEPSSFDFAKRYRAEDWDGIAWYALGYEKVRDEDYEWTGIEIENTSSIVCVMVGDDREYIFDVRQLSPLEEDEYCPECGQIGCKAYNVVEMIDPQNPQEVN